MKISAFSSIPQKSNFRGEDTKMTFLPGLHEGSVCAYVHSSPSVLLMNVDAKPSNKIPPIEFGSASNTMSRWGTSQECDLNSVLDRKRRIFVVILISAKNALLEFNIR